MLGCFFVWAFYKYLFSLQITDLKTRNARPVQYILSQAFIQVINGNHDQTQSKLYY